MRCLIVEYNSASLAVIRNLGRAGFGTDMVHRWSGAPPPRSRFCRRVHRIDSWQNSPAIVDRLLRIVEEGGYGCVLPCGDRSARILSDHRDRFAELLPVERFLPSREAFETAISKAAITRKALELGLAVPRTLFDPAPDEVEAFAAEHPGGVVIKRDDSFSSRGVRLVEGGKEARLALDELRAAGPQAPILAQERIPGPGYLFHTLFWGGRPYRQCLHRKAHEYPQTGGVSARGVTEHHEEPLEAGTRLMRELGWHGLVKLDYIRSRDDGRWYLIEADPRVSASIDMTRVAGGDQAVALARLVDGEELQPNLDFRDAIVYRWLFPRDLLVTSRSGEWGRFLLDFLRPGVYSDMDLLDPGPTLNRMRHAVRKLRDLRRQAGETPVAPGGSDAPR